MHYHIILTEACNLQCKYCYEKSLQEFDNGLEKKFTFTFDDPCTSQIKTQDLKNFIEKDENPTIIFYGGEPLLQIDKIKEIIDAFPATSNLQPATSKGVAFRMQTNAQLLHLLPKEYTNQITKILISIDGDEKTTNKYRGKKTYQKIINNINLIKQRGYKGELIARMTVAQDNPNIYKNVLDIINLKSADEPRNVQTNNQQPKTNSHRIFDSVHWQLDANFYKEDFNEDKIKNFFKTYNASISKLISYWTQEIQKGKLHRLYPFIAITKDLLETNNQQPKTKNSKAKALLRCGAGHSGYAITTSGKVVACPIMNNIKDFECGTLKTNPNDLKKITPIAPCTTCEEKTLCGGRCLYSNHAKLWGEKGEKLVCDSIKHLINELRNSLPKIKEAIKQNKISEKDFEYEKYFGPEIIP